MIVGGVVGEYRGELGEIGEVAPSRMQHPAMEEQHVALVQFRGNLALQDLAIVFNVGPEEEVLVVLIPAQIQSVRTRYQPKAAVLLVLGPKREPCRHEFRLVERPVADILVPARGAAKGRILGHDAVVVSLGKFDAGPEQRA